MTLTLTKSLYVTGVFCPKLFWMKLHRPQMLPKITIDAQLRMKEGQKVGELATQLWPDGVLIGDLNQKQNIIKTKSEVSKRVPLFEAGFSATINNASCYARVDILVPVGKNSWDLFEVKSSTKVKEEYYHDVAFQARVLTNAGITLNRIHVVYVNSDYVRKKILEPIDVKNFFESIDVTDSLAPYYDDVEQFAPLLNSIAKQESAPETICEKPKDCPACSQVLPEHSVFELTSIRSKSASELWKAGHTKISTLPKETRLTRKQAIQSMTVLTQQAHIETQHIQEFLQTLSLPLYHLDFETFNSAIPKFEGVKPYQQIPFQYSLHIQEPTGETKHIEFLAEHHGDPRLPFLASLKTALANTSGVVLAYNASFEARILRELMQAFPEHEVWITEVLSRLKDLAVPFKNFWYYHPNQHGSYSIKAVLPILTTTSYKNLVINNGGLANASFLSLENANEEERKATRKALLAYCQQDTQSMIDILESLKQL